MATVVELPKRDNDLLGNMVRNANKDLMVSWINADLINRAGHDVRKSIVFYDAEGYFETALLPSQWDQLGDKRETFLERLAGATRIRFWSKGVR